jgi:hypothetical protein
LSCGNRGEVDLPGAEAGGIEVAEDNAPLSGAQQVPGDGVAVDEAWRRFAVEFRDAGFELVAPALEEGSVVFVECFGVGETSSCVADWVPFRQRERWRAELVEAAQGVAQVGRGGRW